MKTNSALYDRSFLPNNTLNRDNSMRNTNYNTTRKLCDKNLNFDNRQEYEIL